MTKPDAGAEEQPSATCTVCGTSRPPGAASALAWSRSIDGGADHALCPACTRAHLRAIEAKLPEEWWEP